MGRYIAKRIGQGVLSVFLTVAVVFILLRMAPGDPAYAYAPPLASQAQLDAIREEMGLNKPILVQFWIFLVQLVHGNMGTSFSFHESAVTVVLDRLPYTITLATTVIVVAAVISVPLGVWMARKNNTGGEFGANILTVAGQSMPDFWIGIMLILLFSIVIPIFPSSGFETTSGIVLPTITVAILLVALVSRMVSREMVRNLRAPYITIGRARGVSERKLVWGYALSNSAIPVVTALGTRFAAMLNGVVVVEVVFGWPGVGSLVVRALDTRDFPLIQATVLITVILAIVVQLGIDLIYPLLDPRVRLGKAVGA
jgi:peptide/nickel transport system permease protein